MIANSEVSFCVDTLLVETILSDSKFHKTAGFVSDVLTKVREYLSTKIDKEHPVRSVLAALAPGALWLFLQSIGLGKWGFLLGLLADVFHVDIPGMLKSLYEKVSEMITGNHKVSSSQVDSAVQEVAQQYSAPGSEQEAQEGYRALQQKREKAPEADDHKVYSSLELLEDARMFRLALIEYEHQKMRLTKNAIGMPDFLKGYGRTKAKGSSLLARIFGWIVKIALLSAGLMVAGDAISGAVGLPSSMTGTYQYKADEKTPETTAPLAPVGPHSTQTKYQFKADSPLPFAMNMTNNPTNIENMLIQFAKDTYNGLDGKENIIRMSPAFQAVKDNIAWFNVHNPGTAQTFIPRNFTSRRQLVDYFIDDVAQRDK